MILVLMSQEAWKIRGSLQTCDSSRPGISGEQGREWVFCGTSRPGIDQCCHFGHSVAFSPLKMAVVFPDQPVRGSKFHMLNEHEKILSHESSCVVSAPKLSPFNLRVITPSVSLRASKRYPLELKIWIILLSQYGSLAVFYTHFCTEPAFPTSTPGL